MGKLSRFNISRVVRAHIKHLGFFDSEGERRPDVSARLVLWGVPTLISAASVYFSVRLPDDGLTIASLSLLVGSVLAALPQVVSIKRTLPTLSRKGRSTDADVADEILAHLTLAAIVGIGAAVVATVLALDFDWPDWASWVGRVLSGLVVGAVVFTLLLILVSLPRLFYLQDRHSDT